MIHVTRYVIRVFHFDSVFPVFVPPKTIRCTCNWIITKIYCSKKINLRFVASCTPKRAQKNIFQSLQTLRPNRSNIRPEKSPRSNLRAWLIADLRFAKCTLQFPIIPRTVTLKPKFNVTVSNKARRSLFSECSKVIRAGRLKIMQTMELRRFQRALARIKSGFS